MNDTQVGDRVRLDNKSGPYSVICLEGKRAWVKSDGGCYYTFLIATLTRIEPEPIALTPKYAVGESVRTAQNKTETVIKGIFITYETTNLGTWDECELEPVPEPCDKCGK